MKLHRFFINKKIDDSLEIEITDVELVHQLLNVLRIKIGDRFIFLDGEGNESEVKCEEVLKNKLTFSKEKIKKSSKQNEIYLSLCPAILKKDKMEYVLQKCTEIGVLEFCPIVSNRTEKINLNMKRLDKIVREASEQSEKSYLPSIHNITNLNELILENETNGNKYFLDMNAPLIDVTQIIKKYTNHKLNNQNNKITIFIGPEGGWSEEDVDLFVSNNVKPISLGETVLRAETASIAISSLILLGK